ncbi:class I SAM-dependent methyltransferase [uncultured Jatrophihabitans sp.]|uniref:class I SAM-dependent methyltransferase n=1 Tax=uncultured Jatrophihabitans sp. TaxID=1610747 RepID=UPI0035C94594
MNIHYDALLDRQVPASARRVLDAGCGDGFLAARLAGRIADVVAVDVDAPVLQRAAARFPHAGVDWRHADVMTGSLGPPFDAVVSNAALHHLPDTASALNRLGALVRPGGTLAVVGFVRTDLRELPWRATAWVARGIAIRLIGVWQHTAPVCWPPRDTLHAVKLAAARTLPGAHVHRLVLGRYLLVWHRTG